VPLQLPGLTVSTVLSFGAPAIVGALVFFGAWPLAWTTSVGREVAVPDPELFVAVTMTRSRWPTSAAARVYRLLVAPPIGAQLPPAVSHRCHTYENDFGAFLQLPLLAVRTEPSVADPEIEGSDVFAGTALDTADPTPARRARAPAAVPASRAILFIQLMPTSSFLAGRIPFVCVEDSHRVQRRRNHRVRTSAERRP
jgi:hypothetical protein